MVPTRGLLLVYTGQGKGKTTAAIGQAFRALGHGMRVCFIQFIKGPWCCGEVAAAERFGDLLQWHVTGRGFTWESADREEDIRAAQEAWALAREVLRSGEYELVVLDELTYLLKYGMVEQDEVLEALATRRDGLHVVVTGREAPPALLALADLASEMTELRHPYQQGEPARKGIEF